MVTDGQSSTYKLRSFISSSNGESWSLAGLQTPSSAVSVLFIKKEEMTATGTSQAKRYPSTTKDLHKKNTSVWPTESKGSGQQTQRGCGIVVDMVRPLWLVLTFQIGFSKVPLSGDPDVARVMKPSLSFADPKYSRGHAAISHHPTTLATTDTAGAVMHMPKGEVLRVPVLTMADS